MSQPAPSQRDAERRALRNFQQRMSFKSYRSMQALIARLYHTGVL